MLTAITWDLRLMVGLVLGLSGAEWTALMVAVVGAGGVGSLVTGSYTVWRGHREDKRSDRSVATEEMEAAVRVMGATLTVQQRRIKECDRRWRQHTLICPLLRPSDD